MVAFGLPLQEGEVIGTYRQSSEGGALAVASLYVSFDNFQPSIALSITAFHNVNSLLVFFLFIFQ
jgi:hypothetical protein